MPGQNYAGWAREAIITAPAWPSASSALVTHLLPLLSMDVQQGVNKQFYQDQHGPVGFSQADVLGITPSFSMQMPLRYRGLEPIYAAALGLEARRLDATIMPEEIAPGVYRRIFECDPVLSAMAPWDLASDGIEAGDIAAGQRKVRRGTVAAYREFGVWEWRSSMIDQFSLAWQADTNRAICTLGCLAHSDTRSSVVNTPTTIGRAVPNAAPDVRFSEAVIRLGPYSAATPLNDTHRLACESASVTLQNGLVVEASPRVGLFSEEFERGSLPQVQGSLLRPRYAENTLVEAWRANTRYALEIRCTGPYIADTAYRHQFNVYIPGLMFTQAEPSPLSVARSSLPIQWFAAATDAQQAGHPVTARMSPMTIEVVSGSAVHTLL